MHWFGLVTLASHWPRCLVVKQILANTGLYSSNCRRFFVCGAVNWEPLGQFTSNFAQLLELIVLLFGEILIFHSRVMGLYSSNCRQFFVCRAVNWELLGQFTSNFAQFLELIVLRSVYFLVKFRFFIQELWKRKSLQILYECWRIYSLLEVS